MSKILFIDLSNKSYNSKEIPHEILKKFIGGRGLGIKLLYDLVDPEVNPLDEGNKLIFTAGPLQGTGIPFSGRTQLITKSPQTGIYLYSNSGGTIGMNMNACGYIAMVIEGKSDIPVFLEIIDQKVKFHDARQYWGLKTTEAQKAIENNINIKGGAVAVIGPAGENLVKTASVVTEGEYRRTFARGGVGAVFGSKNLKGLFIKGSLKTRPHNSDLINEAKKQIIQKVKEKKEWRDMRIKYGTPADIELLNERGLFPTHNWRTGVFNKVDGLKPEVMREKFVKKDVACSPYCLTPCSKLTVVKEGPYAGYTNDGPEYETVYSFGSNCGIDRYDAIIAANRICDELGMDTISAGVTIGFAMECFEEGLISLEDTEGLELNFGNHEAVIKLLEKMAYRDGFGNILADGVKVASEKIGKDSQRIAMHSKGMEFGGYECRGSYGQALQYAMSSRGGCHHDLGLPARAEIKDGTQLKINGKGEQVKDLATLRIIYDSAILCSFGRTVIGKEPIAKAISGLWGEEITEDDLNKAAIRTLNLERCFNVLTGIRRKDDRLPSRLLKEPLPDGPNKGSVVPLEELKDDYYNAFGWDVETGIPKIETLVNIGLEEESKKIQNLF